MAKEMTYIAAMKDFFGLKDGQDLKGFLAEVKTLDDADRAYFTRELATVGYTVQAKA